MHPSGQERPESNTVEDWQQVRRSVEMLPPGSWAIRREQALGMLDTLIGLLRGERGERRQSRGQPADEQPDNPDGADGENGGQG